jgi:hypothetical protein
MKYLKSWWYLQSGCEVTWFFRYAPHLLGYLMSEARQISIMYIAVVTPRKLA